MKRSYRVARRSFLAGLGGALSIVAVMQQQFWILLLGGLLIGLARGATEQRSTGCALGLVSGGGKRLG